VDRLGHPPAEAAAVLPLTVNETAFRKRVDQHQPVSGYSSRRLKPPRVSGQRFFVKLAATDFGLMSGGSLHVASLSSSGLRRWTPIAGWAICRRPSACSCSTISRPAPRVLKASLSCAIATLWIWQSRQRKRATKVVSDAGAPLIFFRCRTAYYASRILVMSSSVSMSMTAKATRSRRHLRSCSKLYRSRFASNSTAREVTLAPSKPTVALVNLLGQGQH